MSRVIDLTGKKFGRLEVIERAENGKGGQARWKCKCECGNTTIVLGGNLRHKKQVSCGCYLKDMMSTMQHFKTHGASRTRLYRVWNGMKQRVSNKNRPKYKYYGGRGISICKEWFDSFESFSKWAYENGYKESVPYGVCTLDRIDTNGNYEPSNCRWVTIAENNRNRRTKTQVKIDEMRLNQKK